MTDDTAITPPPRPGRGKLRRTPTTLDLTASPVPDDRVDGAPEETAAAAGGAGSVEPDTTVDAAPGVGFVMVPADDGTGEAAGKPAGPGKPSGAGESPADNRAAPVTPVADDGANRLHASASAVPPYGAAATTAAEPPASPPEPPPSAGGAGVSGRALALAALAGAIAGGVVSFLLMPTSTPYDETAARLVALERRVAALPAGLSPEQANALSRLSGLSDEVAGLGRQVAAATEKADAAAGRIAVLEGAPRVATQPGVSPDALRAQERRLDAIEGAVGNLDSSRLAAISTDAASRTSRVATLAAQALVAEDLAGRIRRGDPFGQTLDRLAGLGVPDARLAALRQPGGAGLPALTTLRAEFAGLAEQLARPSEQAASEDFTSRAMASINRLVRIRTVSGDNTSAGVAAVETALARGDAAAALAAWRALPQEARTTSAGFGSTLERRVAVEAAAQALAGEIVAALAAQAQTQAPAGGAGARP